MLKLAISFLMRFINQNGLIILKVLPALSMLFLAGYYIGHGRGYREREKDERTEIVISENKVMIDFIGKQKGIYDALEKQILESDPKDDGPVSFVLKRTVDGLQLPTKADR